MPFLLSALPTPFSSFLLSFILYPGFLLFLPSILISSIPPPRLHFLLIFDISFLFPSTPAIFPSFFYESFCTRSSLFSNLSSISPPFFVFIFIFFPSLSLMALHPFLSSTLHYPISSLPHCLAFFPPSISHFLRPPSFPIFLYIFYESSLDKAALVWKKTYTFVCFSLVDYFYC